MSESLPDKLVSECWQDDKRMNSLFIPFRKKELNPVDWESKMKFWHSAIGNWTVEKNDCIISVKKLQKEFKRKERSPLCLPTVFNDLERNGEITKKEDFIKTASGESWTNWALNSFVKGPLLWSFSKLKGGQTEPDISEIDYIHMGLLKARGNELLSFVRSKKKFLLSAEDLERLWSQESGREVPEETFQFILLWLEQQGKASVVTFEGHSMVKFAEADNSPASVSEADTALFTLKQTKKALIKNLEALEVEKQDAVEEARAYLKKGMRHAAKSSLRKKKELEKCIAKRSSALDNTEVLLSRIREAESDTKVLEAYRLGLSALKATFKNAGLTEDSVLSTMDEVHEAIDVHEEIQSALSQSVEPVMDDELEEELAGLVKLQEQKVAIDELPEVPDHKLEDLITEIKEMKVALPAD